MLIKIDIIDFIIKHNPKQKKEELMKLSVSALVIIKVQLEIEMQQSKNSKQ